MKIFIRRCRYGDEKQISSLVTQATLSTVNPFFIKLASKETTAQFMLMLAAVAFIVFGTPLKYCLLVLPATFGLIYFLVWIGHHIKAWQHTDLNCIDETYMSSPRCGLWVAEVVDESSNGSCEYLVESNSNFSDTSRRPGILVGTVAVVIKDDQDKTEPPGSVAWMRRLAVHSSFKRKGLGEKLVEVGLKHSVQNNFRAVELVTTECHEAARGLYLKKGFEIYQCYKRDFMLGLASINLYRLRMPCNYHQAMLRA